MWRTAVLFGSLLILFIAGLFFVRQQPPADRQIVLIGNDSLYRMTMNGKAIRQITDGEIEEYSIAPSGELIAYIRQNDSRFQIRLVNMDGTNDKLIVEEQRPRWITWSPDQTQFAYTAYEDGMLRLLLYDLQTHQREIITKERMALYPPVWRGNRLVFQLLLDSPSIGISITDTVTKTTTLAASIQTSPTVIPAFSPDGEWIVFAAHIAIQGNGLESASSTNENSLYAVHHDGRALRLVTIRLNVIDKILWTDDWIIFSATPESERTPETSIYKVKPDGSELTRLTNQQLNARVIDVSSDGQWILAETKPLSGLDKDVRLMRVHIDGAERRQIATPFDTVRNGQWAKPINLDWNPSLHLLIGFITGGGYVAYRRFVV